MAKSVHSAVDELLWPWVWAGAAALVLALYLAIFFLFVIGGPETGVARVQFLGVLLLPDEVLANAVGDGFVWQGVLDRGEAIGAAAVGVWCALWLGWWPLRWISGDDDRPRWERFVMAAGLGLHLISLLTLAVGLAGLLQTPALAVLLGTVGVAFPIAAWWWHGNGLYRAHSLVADKSSAEKDSRPRRALWLGSLAVACLFSLLLLLGAALPPWDFDVREYHLQVPKEWYQSGRIEFLPHNIYGNMPLGAEMLPLAAMSVLGDWWLGAIVGKTLMGACAVLTAAAIYGLVRRWASPLAATSAALVWLTHPWVIHVSISGLNEQVYSLYLILAVSAVSTRGASWRNWVLAGIFAGAAAACKYPAVLMLALPLGAWSIAAPRLDGILVSPWRLRLACAGCFVLSAAVSGGAWYVKNAVQSGNPVYPLLGDVLDGKTRTPEKNEQFARGHAVPPYSGEKLAESAARVLWRSEYQSPLVVPLLVLGVVALAAQLRNSRNEEAPNAKRSGGRRPPHAAWIAIAALLAFFVATWWLFTHRIDRFLVPAIPLAAALAGVGVEFALVRPVKFVAGFSIAAGILYGLILAVSPLRLVGDNRWLVPLTELRRDEPRRDEDVSRVRPGIAWLNANVPPGQAVLCIGEAAVFDLEMPVYYHTCFDDCLLVEWTAGRTAAECKQLLAEKRVAFVFVDWGEIDRYRGHGNYGFDPRFSRELLEDLVAHGVLAPPRADAPPEIYPVMP